jgi:hypothetical protein
MSDHPPCLRCSAIYDEPPTRGFCSWCWNEVILPGARYVEGKGALSAVSYIGLVTDTYLSLRQGTGEPSGSLPFAKDLSTSTPAQPPVPPFK